MNQSQQILEALGAGEEVKVYDKDRKKVLAVVSPRVTSVGAARAAGVRACEYAKVGNEYAWVAKE